jgi:cell division protein FtsQ
MARSKRNRRNAEKLALPKLKLPALPRPTINWHAIYAFLTLCVVAAVSVALGRQLLDLPVKRLDIDGHFQHVTRLEIAAAVEPALAGKSFLTLDLADIRSRIADINWVDTVTLQRVWPDTLRIAYREHQAAARWGSNGLLNTSGELFAEDLHREYQELPKLDGPEGSHRRVARRYLEVRDRLSRANLRLASITMDARGAFSMELDRGIRVRIGREDIEGRLERFFDVAVPSLNAELGRIAYIDMRYPKGFSVGWRTDAPTLSSRQELANSG